MIRATANLPMMGPMAIDLSSLDAFMMDKEEIII